MNEAAINICKRIGIRGVIKSIYLSLRHTGSMYKLILSPRTITEISNEATIDISSYFMFGSIEKGATHINLGNSKLSIDPNGSVTVPSSEGAARIGPCSVLHVEGDFSMGNSYINSHSRIICEDRIVIRDDCAIAWNLEMLDTDRHQLIIDSVEHDKTAPIEIKDEVWIGHHVSIGKGVTIGEGSVIASNSVVVHDVPPNTLVAGIPAEVIRENVEWR
ncbi:acyltransferase [Halalkalicoccus salilacus]|uniref:acyltransferase n=1 Tax=Halalkalicoccus TaxID=332246 RepID=UPI002F9670C5